MYPHNGAPRPSGPPSRASTGANTHGVGVACVSMALLTLHTPKRHHPGAVALASDPAALLMARPVLYLRVRLAADTRRQPPHRVPAGGSRGSACMPGSRRFRVLQAAGCAGAAVLAAGGARPRRPRGAGWRGGAQHGPHAALQSRLGALLCCECCVLRVAWPHVCCARRRLSSLTWCCASAVAKTAMRAVC